MTLTLQKSSTSVLHRKFTASMDYCAQNSVIRCAPCCPFPLQGIRRVDFKIWGSESSSGDKVHATQTSTAHTSTARLEKWRQKASWDKLAIQCSKNSAFHVQWETWPRQTKWRMVEEDACIVLWSGCMQAKTLKSFLDISFNKYSLAQFSLYQTCYRLLR